MRIVHSQGEKDLATVNVAMLDSGHLIEFVESVQPPIPRSEKWVLIVSTLRGCPVSCPICDAGTHYHGKLTARQIMWQIDQMVTARYPDRNVPVPKFKIQFARMGDPAFNIEVLEVLAKLPMTYEAPGLIPSISTIAPASCNEFFRGLREVKEEFYRDGMFQMQFSLHTTCEKRKRELIPARTWSFKEMSQWGSDFRKSGDRKVALNFAPVKGYPLDSMVIADTFSTDDFLVKLTPVNPTNSARIRGIQGSIDPDDQRGSQDLLDAFREAGFDTILSIGETRENQIGSNCGMYTGRVSSI